MHNHIRTAIVAFALIAAPFATITPASATIPLTPADPVATPQTAEPIGIACVLIYPTPPECALASLSAGISSK